MNLRARDVVRVAVPLLAGRALTPFIARLLPLPRALAHARTTEEAGAVWLELDGRPFLEPRTENLAAFNVIYAHDGDAR